MPCTRLQLKSHWFGCSVGTSFPHLSLGVRSIEDFIPGSKRSRKGGSAMVYSSPAMLRWSFVVLVGCAAWSTAPSGAVAQVVTPKEAATSGLAAWQQIYSVLTHPRCIDCHTATNYPQQGDDRHRHLFNVVRGPGGKGVAGLNCATCHQSANADSTGVPGAYNWHLAPLSMKWQDVHDTILSSAEVCRSLIDSAKHDHLNLLKHHEQEPLVLWAFQPGRRRDGTARSLPPLTHAEFVAATRTWIETGMPCPQNP
jgi:mono/diheme cytochrome c family protein